MIGSIYKVKQIDLDVEGDAIEDQASNDRRSQALTKLVAANPGLRIRIRCRYFHRIKFRRRDHPAKKRRNS